jgi:hypothetical protein
MWKNHLRVLGLIVLMTAPKLVFAAGGLVPIVPDTCTGAGGCQSICDLATLAQNILNDGIYIAVFLSAVLFAWAGWQFMTAGGNPSELKRAKSVFSSVFIGLVILLAAWLIVDTLMSVLVGNGAGHLPWNKICQ